MATYYVDTARPDDTGDGLSEGAAWKTIAKVNSSSFSAGDSILFKRGCAWREQLVPPSAGSAGNTITFGAYGSGANPVIKGSDLISNWTLDSGNVWQTTVVWQPGIVWFNGTRGTSVATKVEVDSAGDWYWAANVLYVYSTSDPDAAFVSPGIEVASRTDGIYLNQKDYVTINGLVLTQVDGRGIQILGANHATITNCYISETKNAGVLVNTWSGVTATYTTVNNCTISLCGGAGIQVAGDAGRVNNATISHNTVTDCGWMTHTDNQWTGGIKVWGGNYYYGGDPGESEYTTIEYNTVSGQGACYADGSGTGIWVDQWGSGAIVRYNLVHNNDTYGILIENMDGAEVYYNVVHTNGNHGILVSRSSSGNKVYNNVSYNHLWWAGLACVGITVENYMINNIFKNNISYLNDYNLQATDGGENAGNGSGNVYTNNCLGGEGEGHLHLVLWGASEKTTYDAWESAYGSSTHSVEANPLFVNAAGADFRLQAGSPCILAGAEVGLTQDFTGAPVSWPPDIGAFAYAGGTRYRVR